MIKNTLLIVSLFSIYPFTLIKLPGIVYLLVSIAQILVIFLLFKDSKIINEDNFISNQLYFIGKHSLEIYFIHYYLIFGLPELGEFIKGQKSLFIFRGGGSEAMIELLSLLPITIALSYTSIYISKVFLKISPDIYKLLFGKNKQ